MFIRTGANFEKGWGIAQDRQGAIAVSAYQAAHLACCGVAVRAHLRFVFVRVADGALAVLLCLLRKSFVAVWAIRLHLGAGRAGLFFLASAPERRFQAGFFFGRQERAAGRTQNPQLVR